jgi:PEGA domain
MLKTLTLALLVTFGTLMSVAQSPMPNSPSATSSPIQVVLADGTPIKLRLGSASATSGARVGENLELEVAEDVRVSDVVVVAKGNVAETEVTGLHAGLGSGARLDLNLRSVALADGRVVPVRATKDRPSRDDQALVISSASQDASIAPGTTIIAFVNGNQQLDLTRLRAAGTGGQVLKVTSTPPNAEITVDGHLTGSTPYVFHVPAGEHSIVVRMVGFEPWQRTVHVAAEAVNVDAPLVKQDGMEAIPASKSTQASLGDLARAARARKAQQSPSDQGGQAQPNTQTGPRDPMEPPAKQ